MLLNEIWFVEDPMPQGSTSNPLLPGSNSKILMGNIKLYAENDFWAILFEFWWSSCAGAPRSATGEGGIEAPDRRIWRNFYLKHA